MFRSVVGFLSVVVCSFPFAPRGDSQNLNLSSPTDSFPLPSCVETPADSLRMFGSSSLRSNSAGAPGTCSKLDTLAKEDLPGSEITAAPPPLAAPPDAVEVELRDAGERGLAISEARRHVEQILIGSNSCSAWFRAKEPHAAEIFRSLEYAVDDKGPVFVRESVTAEGDQMFLQPYVAWSRQDVGQGSTITLNAHGAFFESVAVVQKVRADGGPSRVESSRFLIVGKYTGGSLRARELTLLHELGHVIDLLPLDAGVPDGPEISTRNTLEVLSHCQAQLTVESKRKKKPRMNSSTTSLSALRH
jgi:hypothetical protein